MSVLLTVHIYPGSCVRLINTMTTDITKGGTCALYSFAFYMADPRFTFVDVERTGIFGDSTIFEELS